MFHKKINRHTKLPSMPLLVECPDNSEHNSSVAQTLANVMINVTNDTSIHSQHHGTLPYCMLRIEVGLYE